MTALAADSICAAEPRKTWVSYQPLFQMSLYSESASLVTRAILRVAITIVPLRQQMFLKVSLLISMFGATCFIKTSVTRKRRRLRSRTSFGFCMVP